jgi:hypothetical protein
VIAVNGRHSVHASVRAAIHHTVSSAPCLKTLAGDLDLSPSMLSAASTLGEGDHIRHFPAERLVELMRLTGDDSILMTMAALLGYDLRPRSERVSESINRLTGEMEILSELLRGGNR